MRDWQSQSLDNVTRDLHSRQGTALLRDSLAGQPSSPYGHMASASPASPHIRASTGRMHSQLPPFVPAHLNGLTPVSVRASTGLLFQTPLSPSAKQSPWQSQTQARGSPRAQPRQHGWHQSPQQLQQPTSPSYASETARQGAEFTVEEMHLLGRDTIREAQPSDAIPPGASTQHAQQAQHGEERPGTSRSRFSESGAEQRPSSSGRGAADVSRSHADVERELRSLRKEREEFQKQILTQEQLRNSLLSRIQQTMEGHSSSKRLTRSASASRTRRKAGTSQAAIGSKTSFSQRGHDSLPPDLQTWNEELSLRLGEAMKKLEPSMSHGHEALSAGEDS